MGIETAIIAAVAAGAAGTAYSVYSGERQAKEQKKAQRQAEEQSRKQASQAEQAENRARSNAPDASALLQSAAQPAGAGTMLTGPGGVDPNQLQLSKNTLLGG